MQKKYCEYAVCVMLFSAVFFVAGCSGGGGSSPAPAPEQSASVTWYVPDGSSVAGTALASLFDSNQLYVNVQGATNGSGEIRGEILPTSTLFKTDTGNPFAANPANNPVTFAAILRGDQVRPRNVITAADGYGSVTINPLTRQLTGFIVTSGISGKAAYIHDGVSGTTGAIVLTMEGGPVVWTVPAGTILTDAQAMRLTSGAYYFDVQSDSFPYGEIRGQLNQQVRFSSLTGAGEVPSVVTSATGTGLLALNPPTMQIYGFVKLSGLGSTVTSVSLNVGASGMNGIAIVNLTNNGNGIWSVPPDTVLGAAQVMNFNNDELYFNVRTVANPGGELRGQILTSDIRIGTASLNGVQDVPSVYTHAAGSAIVALNSVTGVVSGSVKCDNVYGYGSTVRLHSGSVGTNGPSVVDLTASSPVVVPPAPGISFKLDIQPVFNAYCAVQYCHVRGGLAPMSLEDGVSYANVIIRVVPRDTADSYLFQRLTESKTLFPRMPYNRAPLDSTNLNLIKSWIEDGALNN